MKRTSQAMKDQVLQYKKDGKTYVKIRHLTKLSKKNIWKILKKGGMVEEYQYKTVNHDFFSKIDCEEKAYMLGLLMADGTVKVSNNNIAITLKSEDTHILEEFNRLMNCKLPLGIAARYKGNIYMRSNIYSKQAVTDLVNLGCVEHKTYKNSPFPEIPADMIRHFIRGYFDGDGHIGMHPNGPRINYIFAILVQDEYRQKFIHHIKEATGVTLKYYIKKECKNNLFTIKAGVRKDLLKIYDYLYEDSTVFLKRKKSTWDKVIESIFHRLNR